MVKKSILLHCIFILTACSPVEQSPFNIYTELAPATQDASKDSRIQPFVKLYNGMKNEALTDLIENAYTEKIYFNDTLVTIDSRKELIRYLKTTAEQVDNLELSVLDVTAIGQNDQDLIVRWTMVTHLTLLGKEKKIDSAGITHLHLNGQGKIILHQDFWDSMQGFYQHIPILGGLLRWIKYRVHS